MTTRHDLEQAAELLDRLIPNATPGPWRDSTVDGNRFAALVADTCIRECDTWNAHWPDPPSWASHPHDGYGGCLVGESHMPGDLRLMAALRNVADHLPGLLRAVAHEDPAGTGHAARAIAAAVIDTHRPRRTEATR